MSKNIDTKDWNEQKNKSFVLGTDAVRPYSLPLNWVLKNYRITLMLCLFLVLTLCLSFLLLRLSVDLNVFFLYSTEQSEQISDREARRNTAHFGELWFSFRKHRPDILDGISKLILNLLKYKQIEGQNDQTKFEVIYFRPSFSISKNKCFFYY